MIWIIINPGHLSLDLVSQLVAIGVAIHRDSRSDIQSHTTSYAHADSEAIINQARPKYSV